MFINAHDRLNVPSTLGTVQTYDTIADPATRVPDMIALDNDASVAVDVRFDANYNKAFVQGTVDCTAGKNIVDNTSDKFKVSIDGETAVVIDITAGAPTSLADILASLNAGLLAAGGNTAKATAIAVGGKYIRISSGTEGSNSSVEILTVAANAYTLLGFTAGSHGTNENSYDLNLQGASAVTVNAGGMKSWIVTRPKAKRLRIRGVASVPVQIDATLMYRHSGVQQ